MQELDPTSCLKAALANHSLASAPSNSKDTKIAAERSLPFVQVFARIEGLDAGGRSLELRSESLSGFSGIFPRHPLS